MQIAPRLLIEQQPVALDEEDLSIHDQRVGDDIVNAAVIDGKWGYALLCRREFRYKMSHVKGLRRTLDVFQRDLHTVTQNRMRRKITVRVVKAVHAERLYGREFRARV